MARAGLHTIVVGLTAASLLMGCVAGGGTGTDGAASFAPAKKSGKERDVEAPEIFSTTDSALWDGRPSLGGIWVASPEVTDPERVVMFNPATGKTVTGALFRRERDNPGPRLQLSSDAAEALGILAGQPTEIKVTALRKEVVEEAAPAGTAVADAAADPATDGKGAGEAAAIASAALAAVDAAAAPAATADPAGTAATAAGGDGTAPAAEVTPKKKTWKERRAEARAAREAKKQAAAAATAAGAVPEGEAASATAETAGVTAIRTAPIESAPLDARKPAATDATETAPNTRTKDAARTGPAAEPAAAPAVAGTGPSRPIQVASFSKEDNARRATEALAKIGITATPQKSDRDGKAVWGVVVMGDDAMLKKIKDAGFADAYYLK